MGEVAEAKERVDAEGQSEETTVKAPFDPLTAGAAGGCKSALVTEQFAPLCPVVDQVQWFGIKFRSIRRGGGAGDCHVCWLKHLRTALTWSCNQI